MFLADLFKSRCRLEAENLLLGRIDQFTGETHLCFFAATEKQSLTRCVLVIDEERPKPRFVPDDFFVPEE